MSRIPLTSEAPGIIGLLVTFTKTGEVLNKLAQCLLVDDHPNSTLPRWVREYIAAECSLKGRTEFCYQSHFAAAMATSPHVLERDLHGEILHNEKYRTLLHLAVEAYLRSSVTEQWHVDQCIEAGATPEEIHLVVLIASAFKMYNTYVKVLGNPGVTPEVYTQLGQQLASNGYR